MEQPVERTGLVLPGISAFGLAIISALWAYDGWNNLPMAAGEVASPQRNLPRALIVGALSVLAIYALINLAYFYALPFSEVVTANSGVNKEAPAVAEKVGRAALGDIAGSLLAFAMTISALSAMSGAILTGSRVPFALARDRLAPSGLARLNRAAVPATAVIVQGCCASLLALTGSFDQLTNSVVFASWIFYAMNAGSVLLLRRRRPELERPYRVPGFPVVPLIFIGVSGLLLVNTVLASPRDSLMGLGLMALSLPFYFLTLRLTRKQATA